MGPQIGITSNQIKSAPVGAIYICPGIDMRYQESLGKYLGREDISFKPLSWFRQENVIGKKWPTIIFDHYIRISPEHRELIDMIQSSSRSD